MSRHLHTVVFATGIVLVLLGAAASSAFAQPGPIRLVSSNGIEQADEAQTPAISADGRFVVFAGKIAGQEGIFRKDLATGELVPVVTGEGSEEPSISADGRYVSFTTVQPLDPGDDLGPRTSDVYVADMATMPPTYELASAIDGCDPLDLEVHPACGLTYEGNSGATATGRVSLSANGREIVFVTLSASNLTEPGVTSGPLPTPALQVAVRNLETDETILISGALDPATGLTLAETPVAGGAVENAGGGRLAAGASLSADGSTVAWLAQHPAAQVPLAEPEAASIARLEGFPETYDEPLVRQVPGPAGLEPPAERIVTGQGFPEMVSGANAAGAVHACAFGSGWNLGGGQAVPVLSADGDQVAMIGQPDGYADAFVADVGGSSTGQVRRLTGSPPLPLNNPCDAGEGEFAAGNAQIKTIAIAPEGQRVAFTTLRQRFPLAPPNLVTVPPASIGVEELYLVDLRGSTLERLTHGITASEPSLAEPFSAQKGATSASFDGNGEVLAFASGAYNLVPGDGNGYRNGALSGSGSDAFVVSDPRSSSSSGSSRISSPPPAIRPRGRWALTARANSLPDGSVRVAVGVPGAGRLGAVASIDQSVGRQARKVAAARRKARLASVLVFILHPARGFRHQVHGRGGLEATLRLRFNGKGGKPLSDELHVRFRFHRGGKKGHEK